jgi:hypothetical protein
VRRGAVLIAGGYPHGASDLVCGRAVRDIEEPA